MNMTEASSPASYWQPLSSPCTSSIQAAIRRVLATLYPGGWEYERRQVPRLPFPYLVQLQPMTPDGTSRQGSPLVVVGKHVSEVGFGFYHPRPLPTRVAWVTLENNGQRASLLLELLWTQFTQHGWYESGGRFLRAIE